MYAVTSIWLVSRTRATLRRAEFGFFGVVVYTRVQTPRRCGEPLRAGVLVLSILSCRPFRTNCWIVGIRPAISLVCVSAAFRDLSIQRIRSAPLRHSPAVVLLRAPYSGPLCPLTDPRGRACRAARRPVRHGCRSALGEPVSSGADRRPKPGRRPAAPSGTRQDPDRSGHVEQLYSARGRDTKSPVCLERKPPRRATMSTPCEGDSFPRPR